MSISKFNPEGYYDPTTYEALTNIEAQERKARFRPLVFICSPFSGDEQKNASIEKLNSGWMGSRAEVNLAKSTRK